MLATALAGETLDEICWRTLGSTVPTEQVLALNSGLAALGPRLPESTPVTLPQAVPATDGLRQRETVKLWD